MAGSISLTTAKDHNSGKTQGRLETGQAAIGTITKDIGNNMDNFQIYSSEEHPSSEHIYRNNPWSIHHHYSAFLSGPKIGNFQSSELSVSSANIHASHHRPPTQQGQDQTHKKQHHGAFDRAPQFSGCKNYLNSMNETLTRRTLTRHHKLSQSPSSGDREASPHPQQVKEVYPNQHYHTLVWRLDLEEGRRMCDVGLKKPLSTLLLSGINIYEE